MRHLLILWRSCVVVLSLVASGELVAGGGVILRDDVCIIQIDFYEAHFTAYQPESRGNEEFCEDLPDTGSTIFVLDFLHDSLKEVPVDFRVIRDATGLGEFVKWEDVQALDDIEQYSIFYRPPEVESSGSYRVTIDFVEPGDYVGIVTAGHPTNNKTYNAVFPFSVAEKAFPMWILYIVVAGLFVGLVRYAYLSMSSDRN